MPAFQLRESLWQFEISWEAEEQLTASLPCPELLSLLGHIQSTSARLENSLIWSLTTKINPNSSSEITSGSLEHPGRVNISPEPPSHAQSQIPSHSPLQPGETPGKEGFIFELKPVLALIQLQVWLNLFAEVKYLLKCFPEELFKHKQIFGCAGATVNNLQCKSSPFSSFGGSKNPNTTTGFISLTLLEQLTHEYFSLMDSWIYSILLKRSHALGLAWLSWILSFSSPWIRPFRNVKIF